MILAREAVLAEATYLTRQVVAARAALIEMIGDQFLLIGMGVADHHSELLTMIRQYANVPMSLAAACLVRLAEIFPQSSPLGLRSIVHRSGGGNRVR